MTENNIGGKVPGKVLINRINHHVYSNNFRNNNQYAFIPQKSTTDVIAAKDFIEEGLKAGKS